MEDLTIEDLVDYILDCRIVGKFSRDERKAIRKFFTSWLYDEDAVVDLLLSDDFYREEIIDYLNETDDYRDEPSTEELCEQEYKNNVLKGL